MDWPTVVWDDDGIRPAGSPDACFYCGSVKGTEHDRECVIVTKRVELSVAVDGFGSFVVEQDVPWFWDEGSILFARNESSWCADNVIALIADSETRKRLEAFRGDDDKPCLCGRCEISVKRVVDATPRRAIKSDREGT